jgi:aspartate/methionine/tyrosine aminotransferase
MIATAKRLEGVGEYYFSKKLREIDALNKQGKNIISLGIGSPDLPPHADVIKVLQQESAKPNVHAYQSYKGSPVLRNAFAAWYKKWYGVELNADTEILPLIGSKEGIMHICMTYLNEGDKVLVPNPGYPTYKSAVILAGGVCVDYNLNEQNNFYPDFNALKKTDLSAVKMMWVNYPEMPTGKAGSNNIFQQIIDFGKKHDILICHDDPYSFILNDKPQSILQIDGALDVAIELNSLSKSHSMAGWRVGVLCANEQRVNEVLRFKSNMDSGMFLPVQLAAAKALSLDECWYSSINKIYKERREQVYTLLNALNCTYSTEQNGLFVWAKIPSAYKNAYDFSDEILYNSNVFITPGGIFGSNGDTYIRVSLCATSERIREAIERISTNEIGGRK